MKKTKQGGFSLVGMTIILLVFVAVAAIGWVILSKNRQHGIITYKDTKQRSQTDISDKWTRITTQEKAFTMKIPDGWALINYPHDYIGAVDVAYKPNVPATVTNSDVEYMGHSLRFRASVSVLDDAGLVPQWASPQPELDESTQIFSIGNLSGKRYKAVFSGELSQTIYEYVFDLKNGEKLDVVYVVHQSEGEKDDVVIVEKAIKTIKLLSP